MKSRWGLKVVAAGLLYLALAAAGPVPAARAESRDVALFYEDLSAYGSWIDYGNYGPVWYPTRVSAHWRPYLDGRWVPTDDGWVFETSEPWGWATYHFGNWLPTPEYGWVWTPGSTWYPATVAWRTSDAYIGWAPLPPPNFVAPAALAGRSGFVATSPLGFLTPPFWTFCRAPAFLLGFGRPFAPTFSYFNCGCLAPVGLVPTFFGQTALLTNYFAPGLAPRAFFAFGPPLPFVALTTTLPLSRLTHFANTVALLNLRNVVPTATFLSGRPFLREAIPAPVLAGQRLPLVAVTDPARVQGQLARPGITPPPANLPALKPEIPQVLVSPGRRRARTQNLERMRGMRLPPQAELEAPRRLETRGPRRIGRPGSAAVPGGEGQLGRPGRPAAGQALGPPRVRPQAEPGQQQLREQLLLRQRALQLRQYQGSPRPSGGSQIRPAGPGARPAR